MDDEAILQAIRDHAVDASEALEATQTGEKPLTVASIDALARLAQRDPAEFWLEQLKERNLLVAFIAALRARGVSFDDDEIDDPDEVIATEPLRKFLARAQSFRCQIKKDGLFAGSGVLVGPSLVLTSWHVIAKGLPGEPQQPAPKLEVLLADGKTFAAKVPARFESECGVAEFRGHAPLHDVDVANRHDVALLELERPAAVHLGHISLAAPTRLRVPSRVVLVHFPRKVQTDENERPVEAVDRVIDFGRSGKIRNVTARRRHDVKTKDGSSGGACFNETLDFIGIHQARFDNRGRFVPAELFVDLIRDIVSTDVAPPTLWSLDGTPAGPLVIGRDPFFRAVAAAADPSGRVRGIRVKRKSADAPSTGLAFSHDILQQLLIRRGPGHRLLRIGLDQNTDDLIADMRSRARLVGLELADPLADAAAIAPGQAPPETTIKGRAENLAAAMEAAAAETGSTVWLFFDDPSVLLNEASFLTIESFVGAALTKPHLRLVIAGREADLLPGVEFAGVPSSDGDRSPGFVVEYIGEFLRADVLGMLTIASTELTGEVDDAMLQAFVKAALVGLQETNGLFDAMQLSEVANRLRNPLLVLAGGG
jgi:Trypsin-like peptidase domain